MKASKHINSGYFSVAKSYLKVMGSAHLNYYDSTRGSYSQIKLYVCT